jgi:hypothetical protein
MTALSAHTKGPWTVRVDSTDGWSLVVAGGPAGRIVANVNPESCPDASSVPAFVVMPAAANARLIAAAPELLEALQELHERLVACSTESIYAGEAYDSFYRDLVVEAIAKATGAQP